MNTHFTRYCRIVEEFIIKNSFFIPLQIKSIRWEANQCSYKIFSKIKQFVKKKKM